MRLAIPVGLAIAALPVLTRASPAASPAAPAGDVRVVVLAPSCGAAPAFFRSFVESLRVELTAQAAACCEIWDATRSPPVGSVLVGLVIDPCDASPERLVVTVDDPARDRSVNRRVLLADVAPVARPRALALAVAELVRLGPSADAAGSEEIAATAPQAGPGPGSAARTGATVAAAAMLTRTTPATQMPRGRRADTSARGDFVVRRYPSRQTTLYGGELSLRRAGRRLVGSAGLGAMAGDRATAFGQVGFRAATAAGQIGVRLVAGGFDTDLAVRGELGWAWIQGTPADAQVRAGSGSALLGGVGVRAAVQLPAERRLRTQLTVEAGHAVRGVDGRVNGQSVAGAAGAYLLFGLGVGLGLAN